MTSLNIVAHPDDDLLFLNPDIAEEIERGDEVKVIYLTLGDDGRGKEYVGQRMEAIRKAYQGAGSLNVGTPISSSCFRTGEIYGQLYQMFNDSNYRATSLSDAGWTKEVLLRQLALMIQDAKPDIIRTHNPNVEPALTHDEPHFDHVDHIYTAKFVQEAAKQFPLIPVYAYMGYPIRYQPPNLNEHQTMLKTTVWRAYQSVDTSVSGNIWDIALDKCYKERIQ